MKKVVLLIGCLMMTIVASAQKNVVDNHESDSIEVNAVAVDEENPQDLKISDCELTNRYGLIVTGGKYGIRDYEKKENVTEVIYDDVSPAFRRRVENEYITYFYIRQGERNGMVGIIESTNDVMTFMSSSESSEYMVK